MAEGPTESPTGDVEYDEEALREAAERFHASQGEGNDREDDPEGGHDPEALEDAAEKMGTDE